MASSDYQSEAPKPASPAQAAFESVTLMLLAGGIPLSAALTVSETMARLTPQYRRRVLTLIDCRKDFQP